MDEASSNLLQTPEDAPAVSVPDALLQQGVTSDDLATTTRVLHAMVAGLDVDSYRKSPGLRPLRKSIASVMQQLHQKTMYEGKDVGKYFEEREAKRTLKRQKTAEKCLQRQYIEKTALRQGRVEKLRAMQTDAADEENEKIQRAMQFMIPDGPVTASSNGTATPLLLTTEEESSSKPPPSVKLPCHRSCYVCKVRYRDLHAFYDQLCPSCATLNWEKRQQSCNLRGKVAVITGARVKIGYHVTLKLLQAGCTVVATTRFPNAAVEAFRKEPDFETFRERLFVYGLDLRDVPGLEAFVRYLKQKFATNGVDILINNACQTVRRPAGYYTPLVEKEQTLWAAADDTHRSVLGDCLEFERIRRRIVLDQKQGSGHRQPQVLPEPTPAKDDATAQSSVAAAPTASTSLVARKPNSALDETTTPFETQGISHSAAMSQMIILPEDVGVDNNILPPGVSDINGHQLDLRTTNSWLLKMEEVSTPELMECMFVNAMAPFVLNSRLKPLMSGVPEGSDRPDRYIINVSAMEGKVSLPSVCFAVGQRCASSLTTTSCLLLHSSIATR